MENREYSIKEIITGLESGKFTSRDLVEFYINRILKYDQNGPTLNSIAEINPQVYEIADILDEERRRGFIRSKIHGLPIIIKDNINTNDMMHTSASSIALSDFYAFEDAFIIEKLRACGAIILGKANLSEFAYFMSFDNMPSGYGSRFGQVKSPYSKNIDPLGSSTGSAVAVAANLIAVAIGTETNGSLTAPAKNNSIVTIKPTLGLVSRSGIIPISRFQDTAGPLARSVEDCAYLLQEIYGYDESDLHTYKTIRDYDFVTSLDREIKNNRVGFVKFKNLDYDNEEIQIEEEAKKLFQTLGCEIIQVDLEAKEMANHKTLIYDFKVDFNHYLAKYKPEKIRSLKDLIAFNLEDPEKRLKYGQSIFTASEATSGALTEKEYYENREKDLLIASEYEQILKEDKLDVIISVKRTSHAPVYGNPTIAVPAKALLDDNPRSLFFTGQKYKDDHIIAFAHLYEIKTKKRIPPDLDNIR